MVYFGKWHIKVVKDDVMIKSGKQTLVIIDPQNDFCDHRGSLYVDGAAADIKRLTKCVIDSGTYYSDVYISMDSHDVIAIFHPRFWTDKNGEHPTPFTAITLEDFFSGGWRALSPANQKSAEQTFKVMTDKGIDSLMIWPEHCVVSTWGHHVCDTLRGALSIWRQHTGRAVRFIFKGENPYTDQFSIFEGLDDTYPETAFNEVLFRHLADSDSVTFAGEALSHCTGESVLSYMNHLAGKKQHVVLLTDCTSPVSGFDRSEMLSRLAEQGVEFACTGV